MFNFTKDYILENDKVKLIPLHKQHVHDLAEVASEEELWTYFIGDSNGKGRFKSYVNQALAARKNKEAYTFAIYDKGKGKYAGSTRFFEFSTALNSVRLGYTWLGSLFQGTGLNKNCKYLIFQFAFEQIGFDKVGLGAHTENEISIAAMKSVGCKPAGTLPDFFPAIHGQGRADAVLLNLHKTDWIKTVKQRLEQKI